jgi:hypothetical protein
MTGVIRSQPLLMRLREPAGLRRGVAAGAAWGVTLTIALTALTAWQCGGICIDDAIWLGGVSTATGLLAIGPIAAFGRRGA